MRTKLVETNKPEKKIYAVRNGEATATIPKGSPVCLNLSATPQPTTGTNGQPPGFEDGLQVVLPSTIGKAVNAFWYGVALADILAGQLGEVQVSGVVPYALFAKGSRSATTASWATSDSFNTASGTNYVPLVCSVDSLANAFLSSAAVASNTFPRNEAILLDSFGSQAGTASATSDARTYLTTGARVFVRVM